MGTIKDRSGKNLTEAEEIKKSGKNTQKNYTKKIFLTQIITKGSAKECSNHRTIALISHASNAQKFPSQVSAIREP